MALIGIITAIKAMNQKFTESFSSMGANAFTIRFKERNIRFGGGGDELKVSKKGKKKRNLTWAGLLLKTKPNILSAIIIFPGQLPVFLFLATAAIRFLLQIKRQAPM
nr:hypothetical protein [Niabella ginsengisoli]